MRLGRPAEARVELERAAGLTRDTRERDLLLDRAARCDEAASPADRNGSDGRG